MLKSTAISLLGGLLLKLLVPQQFPCPLPEKPQHIVQRIPSGYYLGISHEHPQLADAKSEAVYDAVKQILRGIGAEYYLDFEKATIRANDGRTSTLIDRLSCTTGGYLGNVVIKNLYFEKTNGKYICYALAFFPQKRLAQARAVIEAENNDRLNTCRNYLQKGKQREQSGNIIDALKYYRRAADQAARLYKKRTQTIDLTKRHIEHIASRIYLQRVSGYDHRSSPAVSCRAVFGNRPAAGIPVSFHLLDGSGTLTPHVITGRDGLARCMLDLLPGIAHNHIVGHIDIPEINSSVSFKFSTIRPKPKVNASALEIGSDGFIFTLREHNRVDLCIDRYEIQIQAEYRFSSFINYYIAHVDSNAAVTGSFHLADPIDLQGGSTRTVQLPFNSWIRKHRAKLDKWYLGSRLAYKIILYAEDMSFAVQ